MLQQRRCQRVQYLEWWRRLLVRENPFHGGLVILRGYASALQSLQDRLDADNLKSLGCGGPLERNIVASPAISIPYNITMSLASREGAT